MFNEGRNTEIQDLTEQIEEVKKVEYMLSARKDIVEIMRVRLASFPCTTHLLLFITVHLLKLGMLGVILGCALCCVQSISKFLPFLDQNILYYSGVAGYYKVFHVIS